MSDPDEISIESTSSKSEKSSTSNIDQNKYKHFKDFLSPNNSDYYNCNNPLDKEKNQLKLNTSIRNIFGVKDDFLDFNDLADHDEETKIYYIGKKTERKKDENIKEYKEDKKDIEEKKENKNKKENKKKKEKKGKYRKDYFIPKFKGNFLGWVLKKSQKLIDNCKFCKKFGKVHFHKANRKLYAGNPKEEDNREFIDKTIEEVFTLTEEQKESLTKKRNQLANEDLINRIKECHEKLSIKKEKNEKHLQQYKAIEEFLNFINMKIDDVMDDYYDSETFEKFKSNPKIIEYDKKFYYGRKRNFSLLEKNNFRRLVKLPYYSNKNKSQK